MPTPAKERMAQMRERQKALEGFLDVLLDMPFPDELSMRIDHGPGGPGGVTFNIGSQAAADKINDYCREHNMIPDRVLRFAAERLFQRYLQIGLAIGDFNDELRGL